ncbi:hypothetical protein BEP19_10340 [Ammoniphilus oxalaticus]|uniref:NlpC/P60 domain-containing protein n=1 Tax=Ammoniphilus oxalaticus TaxID=66863 RepID=A0A419SFU6_9BACL|nr:C40 family peptidase [Ammoniphilus oxalaticus]RKD22649.1 hypothetical protein BEP19_10340 [Ammoniphilus oxalaticus]
MKNFKNLTFRKIMTMTLGLSLVLTAFPSVLPGEPATVSAASVSGSKIVSTGKKYLGVPYKLGGKTPSAFDCQGFTHYVYKKHGINLPFGARNQSKVGKKVSVNNLQVGDLVFFSTKATMKYSASSIKRIGHVGIYAGNGKVLHTWGTGGVRIQDASKGWWRDHYVTARRVLPTKTSSKSLSLTSQAKTEVNSLRSLLKKNGYKSYSNPNDWLKKGKTVSKSSIKRGDIAFFSMNGKKSSIDHAAVYLGNNELLYQTKSGSKKYKANSSYVLDRLVVIKRAS